MSEAVEEVRIVEFVCELEEREWESVSVNGCALFRWHRRVENELLSNATQMVHQLGALRALLVEGRRDLLRVARGN